MIPVLHLGCSDVCPIRNVHRVRAQAWPTPRKRVQKHWMERYVGLPYDEFDCARLVELVLREQFNLHVRLPSAQSWRTNTPDAAVKEAERLTETTFDIVTGQPLREGDMVLMDVRGSRRVVGTHVGVLGIARMERWVLHSTRGIGSVMQMESSLLSGSMIVRGYYRCQQS